MSVALVVEERKSGAMRRRLCADEGRMRVWNMPQMQAMMGHGKMQQMQQLNAGNAMPTGNMSMGGKEDEEPSFFTSVDQEAGALAQDNVGPSVPVRALLHVFTRPLPMDAWALARRGA